MTMIDQHIHIIVRKRTFDW